MKKIKINSNLVLWAVFVSLLAVLLPHTKWFFQKFEPVTTNNILGLFNINLGETISWFGAFTFEAAIAVFTYQLSKHIEQTRNFTDWKKRIWKRYGNIYLIGLIVALGVSVTANYTHAVEFGQPIRAFSELNIPVQAYAIISGAILPFCSLLFAWAMAKGEDAEHETNPEIEALNTTIREARKALRDAEQKTATAERAYLDSEQRAMRTEQRLQEVIGTVNGMFSTDKTVQAKAIHVQWPELSQRGIAQIVNASPAWVNDILANQNGNNHTEKADSG